MKQIFINKKPFEATNYVKDIIQREEQNVIQIEFDFSVSSEEYHDVTVLLYENDFHVKVPDEDLEFQAVISKYSTSVTNLYKTGAIGSFHLTLVEKIKK